MVHYKARTCRSDMTLSMSAPLLDRDDPLLPFAAEFDKPPGLLYLDGNSLGLLCRPAEAALQQAVESWRSRAILAWTDGAHPWFTMARDVAGLLAPLVGAEPADVAVGESTTVMLHQVLATFHKPGGRILIDEHCFPSDRYAIRSRLEPTVIPDRDGLVDESAILDAMRPGDFAVLPAVVYRSGQLLDVAEITRSARMKGATVAWDCSHSVGVVPHRLRADDVDLAFGCTYKHLNGGPGSTAFLYVHPRLRDRPPGLPGWFGSDPARQFDMADALTPAADAGRYLIGTPHVLSLAPLLGSLDLVGRAGIDAIRTKSLKLTRFLRERLEGIGLVVVTPREDNRRGGHVTVSHPQAGALSRALRAAGVVPDFRPPDLLRLAPAPLYTTFAECDRAVDILRDVLASKSHERHADADTPVT